ncbi:MAG: TIGR02757 family protein [Bacteroidota bacterium]
MRLTTLELFSFLEEKYSQYNQPHFIESDPVSVPHRFTIKQDIEIAGFLAATISWGNRKSIVANASRLVQLMDDSPYDFLINAGPQDFKPFLGFVHRTFNGDDCLFFITALKNLYQKHLSLEPLFSSVNQQGAAHGITAFRNAFLETSHLPRSEKHLSDPAAGSATKRINMFLRWMVRNDGKGVDFGIWQTISPAKLICPLDIHVGNVARKLGLLQRNANDWKAAEEVTANLCKFDPLDPVKYDFALFGLGINEKF